MLVFIPSKLYFNFIKMKYLFEIYFLFYFADREDNEKQNITFCDVTTWTTYGRQASQLFFKFKLV